MVIVLCKLYLLYTFDGDDERHFPVVGFGRMMNRWPAAPISIIRFRIRRPEADPRIELIISRQTEGFRADEDRVRCSRCVIAQRIGQVQKEPRRYAIVEIGVA